MSKSARVTYIGIMVGLAIVLQLVEGLIPYPVLGVKLGLANIVSLIALIYFGFRDALLVVVLRTFMASFLSGRLSSFLYSGAGAFLSILVMGFVYWQFRKYYSVHGISILGAIAHNVGQIFVASFLISSKGVFSYLPILLVSGVVTGYFIGLTVSLLEKTLDPMLKGRNSGSPHY